MKVFEIIDFKSPLESFSWANGLYAVVGKTEDELHICSINKETAKPSLFDDGRFMYSVIGQINPGITRTNLKLIVDEEVDLKKIAGTREFKAIIPYTQKEKELWMSCIDGLKLLTENRKKDEAVHIHPGLFNEVDVLHIMHVAFDGGIMSKIEKNELPVNEQKTYTHIFPYRGWDNIEQLEDVIGEEKSCDLHFAEVDGDMVHYDLEITIKRIRRSDKQNP